MSAASRDISHISANYLTLFTNIVFRNIEAMLSFELFDIASVLGKH